MKYPKVGTVYFDIISCTLVEYLGVEAKSMHFREVTGKHSGCDYFLNEENYEDYIEISQIKLLEILFDY